MSHEAHPEKVMGIPAHARAQDGGQRDGLMKAAATQARAPAWVTGQLWGLMVSMRGDSCGVEHICVSMHRDRVAASDEGLVGPCLSHIRELWASKGSQRGAQGVCLWFPKMLLCARHPTKIVKVTATAAPREIMALSAALCSEEPVSIATIPLVFSSSGCL